MTLKYFHCFVLLFLISSTIFIPVTRSQNEPELLIEVYDTNDWNESVGTMVFEGKSYDITVCTENDTVIMNATITVLGKTYQTNYSLPFITIEAPSFDISDTILITATKEGYQPGTLELSVLKGELYVHTDRVIVNENTQFEVIVTDQDNTAIEGALVYITKDSSPILTDQQGQAFAQAPEIDIFTTMEIQVIKAGYLPGSTTIRIENVETTFFSFTEAKFLQILPVLLALFVVIISILYVYIRKKKGTTNAPKEIQGVPPDKPPHKQIDMHQRLKTDASRFPEMEKKDVINSCVEPRIEEIRIPVQSKKKETTILPEEIENEQAVKDEEKHQDEWFKGQDYMRYKIDELTGKIDQQTDGKWFEGEQDTKYKVDEALKKNLKKKKVDESPGK